MVCDLMRSVKTSRTPGGEKIQQCHQCVMVFDSHSTGDDELEKLEITLCLMQKTFYMIRQSSEPSDQFLSRVIQKMTKQPKKKSQSEKVPVKDATLTDTHSLETCKIGCLSNSIVAQFLNSEGQVVNHRQLSCLEVLREARALLLFDSTFECLLPIIWNPLVPSEISLYNQPSAFGIPLLLMITLQHEISTEAMKFLKIIWWEILETTEDHHTADLPSALLCESKDICQGLCRVIHNGTPLVCKRLVESKHYLVPQPTHQHKSLYVTVHDSRYYCVSKGFFIGKLQLTEEKTWRTLRLESFRRTTHSDSQTFRVATFNLLAPQYARTLQARKILFPYCCAKILDYSSRFPSLFSEVLELDCDILSLQECSTTTFHQFFMPCLSHKYTLHFSCKSGNVSEGLCLLFNTSMFEELEFHDFVFHALMTEYHKDLLEAIRRRQEDFQSNILPYLTTVFQIMVLKPKFVADSQKKNTVFIVANTHLFFHPHAPHIRLLQIHVLLSRLAHFENLYLSRGFKVALIVTGDFNSLLTSGGYEFLSTRKISSNHPDWNFFDTYVYNDVTLNAISSDDSESKKKQEENTSSEPCTVAGLNLDWSKGLSPLQDTYAEQENRLTHMVNTFEGTLDYIFISPATLQITRVLPLLPRKILAENIGLPSVVYPSDHLSLAVELHITPQ